MVNVFIPILLAMCVGLTEYNAKRFNVRGKSHTSKLLSFSAGVSITYLLLELFPMFTEGAFRHSRLLFISVLLGFIGHHLIEKQIYQHNTKHDLVKMLTLEEHSFYYAYHVILGIVLVAFTQFSIVRGLLLFFTMISFTIVSNLPSHPHTSKQKALFLSSSTLLGVLIGIFANPFMPEWFEFTLIGLATGVLLFTVTRHHIPFGRKGKIGYFTIAFILYSALIIMSWFI